MTRHKGHEVEKGEPNLGFYFSKTPTVESSEENQRQPTMYCPRCRKTVNQIKSYRGYKAQGQEPVVKCAICGLIHDSIHYKRLMSGKFTEDE